MEYFLTGVPVISKRRRLAGSDDFFGRFPSAVTYGYTWQFTGENGNIYSYETDDPLGEN